MQSFNQEQFPEIRAAQLTQIIEKMQTEDDLPCILCGDLNIPWKSGEPGEELIQAYFYDDYNQGRNEIMGGEQTCTDYFSDLFFAKAAGHAEPVGAYLQILDYTLLFKSFLKCCTMQTSLVPMNRFCDPEGALSDHNGLLTTFERNSFK